MKTVAIVAKPHGEKIKQTLEALCEFLENKGIRVLLEDKAAAVINAVATKEEKIREFAELIIVLGGDGTLISAVRLLKDKDTPVLGINLGRLGFLTETRVEEAINALDLFLKNEYGLEKRMKLHCHIEQDDKKVFEIEVLNDVVINKSDLARIIELEVYIDGEFVNLYRADGLIISTPTGSTAYNLAAGGPIVHPEAETIILSPICPHALTNKPIVINDTSNISLKLRSKDEHVSITFDGQVSRSVDPSMTITVKKASTHTVLAVPKSKNYYSLLREKLGWGDA